MELESCLQFNSRIINQRKKKKKKEKEKKKKKKDSTFSQWSKPLSP